MSIGDSLGNRKRAPFASSIPFGCFAARDNEGWPSIVASIFVMMNMLRCNREGRRLVHYTQGSESKQSRELGKSERYVHQHSAFQKYNP